MPQHSIFLTQDNLLWYIQIVDNMALHLYVIRLQLDEINKTHKQVFEALRAANIGVNLHYIPIYQQPYYQQFGYAITDYPESEKYYAEAISLPMYSQLTHSQQDAVVKLLQKVIVR